MNLIITDWCNRACPYCFAREKVGLLGSDAPTRFLSLPDLEFYLEFLVRSGLRELKLLGGEPTLHPQLSPGWQQQLAPRHNNWPSP